MAFAHQHLLGLEDVGRDELNALLDTAASFKEISERDIKKVPTLRGKTVVSLFYEASTRTRASFEIAAKRMSADFVSLSLALGFHRIARLGSEDEDRYRLVRGHAAQGFDKREPIHTRHVLIGEH